MDRNEALEAVRDFWHRTVEKMSPGDYVWIVNERHADFVGYLMSIDEEAEGD